eukprot:SAG31_NODE_595_length_13695_cov_11.446896_18_plen_77_part_00
MLTVMASSVQSARRAGEMIETIYPRLVRIYSTDATSPAAASGPTDNLLVLVHGTTSAVAAVVTVTIYGRSFQGFFY